MKQKLLVTLSATVLAVALLVAGSLLLSDTDAPAEIDTDAPAEIDTDAPAEQIIIKNSQVQATTAVESGPCDRTINSDPGISVSQSGYDCIVEFSNGWNLSTPWPVPIYVTEISFVATASAGGTHSSAGDGGRVTGTLDLSSVPGSTLHINVGGYTKAADIRLAGSSLEDRVVVAGAGGGCGLDGWDGATSCNSTTALGGHGGGNQTGASPSRTVAGADGTDGTNLGRRGGGAQAAEVLEDCLLPPANAATFQMVALAGWGLEVEADTTLFAAKVAVEATAITAVEAAEQTATTVLRCNPAEAEVEGRRTPQKPTFWNLGWSISEGLRQALALSPCSTPLKKPLSSLSPLAGGLVNHSSTSPSSTSTGQENR